MTTNEKKGFLSDCVIAFLPSSVLAPKDITQYSEIVESNGAFVCEPKRDGSLRIQEVTHIISNTIDFPQFTETQAMMIPVVTIEWIVSSIKRGKQAPVRPFSPDPRMIFSKVTLTCADLPVIDKETIIGATLALGGMESADVTRQTTHICALSLDHAKCQTAIEKKLKVKIVLPHWFEDCFKLGKRIDEGPYLLPDAEILRHDSAEDVKIPDDNGELDGATSVNPTLTAQGPARPATIFQGKAVMISADLSLTQKALNIIKARITNGGGSIVDEVEACDMFICQYRDDPHYVRAAQLGKDVGNLAWLFHLVTRNEWTSPLRRLLHYPIPKEGIPGFKDLCICISNYGGDARIYLENLIRAAGATYTKTMKTDNTHLITARSSSEKYEAAKDWGIETINHLWIEESYAKCEKQPVTVSKYTHFPPRTNLGEIIGQTAFDEHKLRDKFYPGGDESSTSSKRKRKVLDEAHDNSCKTGPAEGVVIGRQEHKEFDVLQDDDEEYAEKTRQKFGVPAPPRDDTNNVKTPVRSKQVGQGKENETPSVASTGGRSAKSKALNNLHRIAPDIALYEREKKRSAKDGHGPWGGKRAADRIDKERGRQSSENTEAVDDEEEELNEDETEDRPKKRRRSSQPDKVIRIMLTGFTRWVDDKHKEDVDRRKLREMGIKIVTEGQPADFLAAPFMVRTVKFLRTLARGASVISSDFVLDCLRKGKLVDSNAYKLSDRENEKKFGVKLETAVARARANNGRLLAGVPIYCTANIRNGPESYKHIAEDNGAQFMQYSARSGVTIRPTTAEEDGGAAPDPVYLLSSESPEERKLWPKFRDMAEKGHMEPRIVTADWLLDVAMRQQVMFDEKYLAARFFGIHE